jgi:dolichyl-phosphate-mannose--protein O-mannosyl transferase
VLLGAAVATKWSGLFALAFGTVLGVAWSRRRGRRLRTLLLPLVAVPALVYLASYASFFAEHGFAVRDFLSLQARMLDHQLHHTVRQSQNSSPLVWPVLGGAFTYFRRGGREIAPIGNPALWFGFLALLPFLFRSVRRDLGARLALGGYAVMFLPWLVFARTQFVSYMTPAVPFMCLGVVAALRGLNTPRRTTIGGAILGASALAAVWLLPVWLGLPAPHMWLSSIDRMFGL